MKKNTVLRVGVLALFAAVLLLTSCYAPLRNQNASLNLSVKSVSPPLPGNQAVLLLIDNSYQDSLAEMLWLINKGYHVGLTTSEADRLTTLAKEVVTNGLVKFGGFPFYQLNVSGPSGVISIPGIPADRSYLVKIFVFSAGFSFDPSKIDQNFFNNVGLENIIYSPGESYSTPFANWTVPAGQIVTVNSGETATVNVSLVSSIP